MSVIMTREQAVACGALGERPAKKGSGSKVLTLDISCSDLESTFDNFSSTLLPGVVWEKEVIFHPSRKWRVDRMCGRVCVECDGRFHGMHKRYTSDLEKYNTLAVMGFVLLRCTADMLRNDPVSFFSLVKRALEVIHE